MTELPPGFETAAVLFPRLAGLAWRKTARENYLLSRSVTSAPPRLPMSTVAARLFFERQELDGHDFRHSRGTGRDNCERG